MIKHIEKILLRGVRRRIEGGPCNLDLDGESVQLFGGSDLVVACVCCWLCHYLEIFVERVICAWCRTVDPNHVVPKTVLNVCVEVKGVGRNVRNNLLSNLGVLLGVTESSSGDCSK